MSVYSHIADNIKENKHRKDSFKAASDLLTGGQ